MATKPIIAVDIDDVLADSAKGFVEFSNRRWGTSLSVDDYQEHWMEMWQVDEEETHRRADLFHNAGVVGKYAHREEALSVLLKLHKTYDFVIVTSRRLSIRQDTLEWLKTHYPGIFAEGAIHFAGFWDDKVNGKPVHQTKADLCEKLGATYLIDDQLKHCLGAAERGIEAILFGEYGWNTADMLPQGVTRVASWMDIEEYFDAKSTRR